MLAAVVVLVALIGRPLVAAASAPSTVPHSPQKRLPAGLSAPHFGQRFASAAPQSPQNFLPGGFSVLQFEQRIGLSRKG